MNPIDERLINEIKRIYNNITEEDRIIFYYLLENTIWNFYHGSYDYKYILPWTSLKT